MTQLLAPRQLSRLIGVDEDNETLMRLLGLRELGAGMGLMQGNSATFLWARVGGDVMDLGLLGAALRKNSSNRNRVLGAMAAVAGVTALDIAASILMSRNPAEPEWRVARDDRAGMTRENPTALRQYADETMAAHESGHLRQGSTREFSYHAPHDNGIAEREEAAVREFGAGD